MSANERESRERSLNQVAPEESPGLPCAATETNKPHTPTNSDSRRSRRSRRFMHSYQFPALVVADLSNFNSPTLTGLCIQIDFLIAFLLDQFEPILI